MLPNSEILAIMHVEKISVACLVLKSRMEFSDLTPKYSPLSFTTIYYRDVNMKNYTHKGQDIIYKTGIS